MAALALTGGAARALGLSPEESADLAFRSQVLRIALDTLSGTAMLMIELAPLAERAVLWRHLHAILDLAEQAAREAAAKPPPTTPEHPDGGTCRLRCPGGSEAGTCPCEGPRECPLEPAKW